jgi:hypothetical protein
VHWVGLRGNLSSLYQEDGRCLKPGGWSKVECGGAPTDAGQLKAQQAMVPLLSEFGQHCNVFWMDRGLRAEALSCTQVVPCPRCCWLGLCKTPTSQTNTVTLHLLMGSGRYSLPDLPRDREQGQGV